MRRACAFFLLVAACTACQDSHPLKEYEATLQDFQDPISVTHLDSYLDFGSAGFTVEDASGKELSFCVQHISAHDPSRNLMFGIGFLHIGARDWQLGQSIPVPPGGEIELQLVDLMRRWSTERFPTWTSVDSIPRLEPRLAGAVSDSLAAQRFLAAIRMVELRDVVLKNAVYPD